MKMAKIYSAPKEVKLPSFDWTNMQEYAQASKQYIADVKQYINDMGYKGKNVGEIVRFAVADGYAEYMVVSMRPLSLMHIPLDDAYEFPYVHLMTSTEINKKIELQRVLAKM